MQIQTMTTHASSPHNLAYCYAELALSSPVMIKLSPVLIAPTRRGMTRLSGLQWPG